MLCFFSSLSKDEQLVKMEEGLHTWPKEKRSFCHDWLPSHDSHLKKEVEDQHLAIKEGAKQVKEGALKQVKFKEVLPQLEGHSTLISRFTLHFSCNLGQTNSDKYI